MTRGVRSKVPEPVEPAAHAILARRAERIRAAPAEGHEDAVVWVGEFAVGDSRYAVPLDVLRAVVPLRRVTPVPLSLPHVIGILRFQGELVTALSLASLLGIRGWKQDPSVLLVTDPGWGRLVALDCEEIPRPTGLPVAALEAARSSGGRQLVVEVGHGTRVVQVIDVAKVLERRAGSRDGT